MANKLYYGDNLSVLRESAASETVDLIYLDPPFNSNASYNVLFKAPSGEGSQTQIEAFEDTWHWNDSAERAFDEVVTEPHSYASIMLRAMRSALYFDRGFRGGAGAGATGGLCSAIFFRFSSNTASSSLHPASRAALMKR